MADDAWVGMPSADDLRALGVGEVAGGFVPGMARLITAHMRIAHQFGPLFQEVMAGPGVLSRGEREMVAAVASAAQDCFY